MLSTSSFKGGSPAPARLDAHVHARALQVHVQAGQPRALHALGHALARAAQVERVAVQQRRLARALAVRLEHVDGLDRVHRLAGRRHRLHRLRVARRRRRAARPARPAQQAVEMQWKRPDRAVLTGRDVPAAAEAACAPCRRRAPAARLNRGFRCPLTQRSAGSSACLAPMRAAFLCERCASLPAREPKPGRRPRTPPQAAGRAWTASTTMRAKKSDSESTILDASAVLAQLTSTALPSVSVLIARCSSMNLHACARTQTGLLCNCHGRRHGVGGILLCTCRLFLDELARVHARRACVGAHWALPYPYTKPICARAGPGVHARAPGLCCSVDLAGGATGSV